MADYKNDSEDILDPKYFKKDDSDNLIQRIKVIGVGGGGNNAVNHMYRKGIKDVSFVLLNTDRQVLDASKVPTKVLIGPGRGAGGKPERARKYAEENAERIAELFDDETDMVFITAGMGGGTGTGAGPVVARIAKERGILTVGIVTVPFQFEGKQKLDKAKAGAAEMAKNVDSLLIINNQRLADIYKNTTILNAFAKADDTLLNAAQSITDIITYQGIINRDFNDVDSTLRDGGTAIISTGYGEGPQRVTMAIQNALHSPLLRNTDIFSSKKLLLILYIPDDLDKHPFNMEETRALDEFVIGIDHGDIEVMWGLYQAPDLGDKVKITILAAGFEKPFEDLENASESGLKVETQPTKAPARQKTPEKYEPTVKSLSSGKVISPDEYDNPESEFMREFEHTPAINRNPYKSYMSNMGADTFRDTTILLDKSDDRKGDINDLTVGKNDKAKKKEDGAGSLLIEFDDI